MKKTISLVLLTTIILLNLTFGVSAKEVPTVDILEQTVANNENTVYLQNHFSSHYFSKLTSNYGNNIKDSCGYVAIGMLMSFYDTYWDDNIIPEQYDANSRISDSTLNLDFPYSPGIKRDDSTIGVFSFTSDERYVEIINEYKDEYYHLYGKPPMEHNTTNRSPTRQKPCRRSVCIKAPMGYFRKKYISNAATRKAPATQSRIGP